MAILRPYPFEALAGRIFREREENKAVLGMPINKAFANDPQKDLSINYFGHTASNPLGPAAGPHSQMAQNIVLAWLAGSGIMELKTIQVRDDIEVSRPCIDMRTVGFNSEWSQELCLDESLDEYIKGYMLVEMLRSSEPWCRDPGRRPVLYDLSIGYDLAGIKSDKVRRFIEGMLNTKSRVDHFRKLIPANLKRFSNFDVPERLANSVTLSTFHGCPPDEIESIINHLFHEYGLNCIIKFNPTLLGKRETRELINDRLGYNHLEIPDEAFDNDISWDRAVDLVEGLDRTADKLGIQLGMKFTNTLIVKNTQSNLPEQENTVYLSGQPLHLIAIRLIKRFRKQFRNRFPISISAGIDRRNFADAVALGLRPITVCTDILKPGGYTRLPLYYKELYRRMEAVKAATINEFINHAYGAMDMCNTTHYLDQVETDPRYTFLRNQKPPRKIQSRLERFNCLTCDICLAVCPNNALFAFASRETELPAAVIRHARRTQWEWHDKEAVLLTEKHQIGLFGDFCNLCGNCDVFCPEHGGPQIMKPAFYGTEASWKEASRKEASPGDGYYLSGGAGSYLILGRINGLEYRLKRTGGRVDFTGENFKIHFEIGDPQGTISGTGPEELDLTPYFIMDFFRRVLLETDQINYMSALTRSKESDHGI